MPYLKQEELFDMLLIMKHGFEKAIKSNTQPYFFDNLIEKLGKNEKLELSEIRKIQHDIIVHNTNNMTNFEDRCQHLINVLKENNLNIERYGDLYWDVFSYGETLLTFNWKKLNYVSASKTERVAQINFLNKNKFEGYFENFTTYLNEVGSVSKEQYKFWAKEAVKNKAFLNDINLLDFFKKVDTTYDMKLVISMLEIYGFCGEQSIDKIREMKTKFQDNALIQQAVHEVLSSLGVEEELEKMDLLLEEHGTTVYKFTLSINPQYFIQEKAFLPKEKQLFMTCIGYLIKKELEKRYISCKCEFVDEYNYKHKKVIESFLIDTENFSGSKEYEIKAAVREIVDFNVTDFLIHQKDKFTAMDRPNPSYDEFADFFFEYMKRKKEVNRLEEKLAVKEEKTKKFKL